MPTQLSRVGEFTGDRSDQKKSRLNGLAQTTSVVRDGVTLTPALKEEFVEDIAARVASHLAKQPRLVNRYDLAKLLKVSVPTIERMQQRGEIPVIYVGRSTRYSIEAVLANLPTSGGQRGDV